MSLHKKIKNFTKRTDRNNLLSGILLLISILGVATLVLSTLEYNFWFGTTMRNVFFYGVIVSTIVLFVKFILPPLFSFFDIKSKWNKENAAHSISDKIPELKDELINWIQLQDQPNELAKASIEKKSHKLKSFNFLQAVDNKTVTKYSKWLLMVVFLFSSIVFVYPQLFKEGTKRILYHDTPFEKPAPFSFHLLHDSLRVFRNTHFTLQVALEGKNIPHDVAILLGDSHYKMRKNPNDNIWSYTFQSLTKNQPFVLEAAGFRSQKYELTLLDKPALVEMEITLSFPKHTQLETKIVKNAGDLTLPENTHLQWQLKTQHTDKTHFVWDKSDTLLTTQKQNKTFSFNKKIVKSTTYSFLLENAYGSHEADLSYFLNVTKDQYPTIQSQFLLDSTSLKTLIITGQIEDDYGFSSLFLCQVIDNKITKYKIPFQALEKNQPYYTLWSVDSLSIQNPENLELYVEVTDNDAPNGFKTTTSQVFSFSPPKLADIAKIMNQKSSDTQQQLKESLQQAAKMKSAIESLSDRIKTENSFSWSEAQLSKDVIEKREALDKILEEIAKKFDDLKTTQENIQENENLKKSYEEMAKSVDNLMDDKTKKLYEELLSLLKEQNATSEIQNKLNEIARNEEVLLKNLETLQELLKRMQIETGMQQLEKQLEEITKQQEGLTKEENENSGDDPTKSTIEKQQEIKEQFSEMAKEWNDLQKLNEELSKPSKMENFDSEQKAIDYEMEEAIENLKNNNQKDAKQNQKKAAKQLSEMLSKMKQSMGNMKMEALNENINHLRNILDNLIKLSFNQENIKNEFEKTGIGDPQFIQLSQDQLKMKDDFQVIEDSLFALSKRVNSLSNFINKELDEVNFQLQESVKLIKERKMPQSLMHQQFTMAALNNLALLLNEVLENMQMTMSASLCNPNAGKKPKMSLSKLTEQQKQLGEKIQKLNNSQKKGKELSKELAQLAAEQELLRMEIQKLKEKHEGQMGGKEISNELKKALEMMEENELDLVHKNLNEELKKRQKDINVRMLRAEKGQKEQELDKERESKTGKQTEAPLPPNIEKYLFERKKEIERLRSLPIELKPFYKKEVQDYFKRVYN